MLERVKSLETGTTTVGSSLRTDLEPTESVVSLNMDEYYDNVLESFSEEKDLNIFAEFKTITMEKKYEHFKLQREKKNVTKMLFLLFVFCFISCFANLADGYMFQATLTFCSSMIVLFYFVVFAFVGINLRQHSLSFSLVTLCCAILLYFVPFFSDEHHTQAIAVGMFYIAFLFIIPFCTLVMFRDYIFLSTAYVILFIYQLFEQLSDANANLGVISFVLICQLLGCYILRKEHKEQRYFYLLHRKILIENLNARKRRNVLDLLENDSLDVDSDTREYLLHTYKNHVKEKKKSKAPASRRNSVGTVDWNNAGSSAGPVLQSSLSQNYSAHSGNLTEVQVLSSVSVHCTSPNAPDTEEPFNTMYEKLLGWGNNDVKLFGAVHEIVHSFTLDFDVWNVAQHSNGFPLSSLVVAFFDCLSLWDLGFSTETLGQFIRNLEESYCSSKNDIHSKFRVIDYPEGNPYHNSVHASDVLASSHYLANKLIKMGLSLSSQEWVSILFAAAIHDYDHPGHNNGFEMAMESELAILYNDRSILENHHVSSAFTRLNSFQGGNIIKTLTGVESYKDIRSNIIELVLITDMAGHFDFIKRVQLEMEKGLDVSQPQTRLLLLQLVIKLADLSHTLKALPISMIWTSRIQDEFFMQGDTEHEFGLQISPFMNRNNANIPKSQHGFLEFVVKPLVKLYIEISGEVNIQHMFLQNIEYWNNLIARNVTEWVLDEALSSVQTRY
eukprot:GCRY01003801.1.p1 GENE.GCRY01003801.1~~GCRY01003801.1.p1  ORF type:complete len:726 (+),score=84.66 GCRY01003801.1:273-2450(+)